MDFVRNRNIHSKKLSFRELQIGRMLAVGNMSKKAIAFELNLSEKTVECHAQNVYRKLNVHSIGELRNLGKNWDVIE